MYIYKTYRYTAILVRCAHGVCLDVLVSGFLFFTILQFRSSFFYTVECIAFFFVPFVD